MVMSKMSRFCTGKMVILLDSSGNNPIKAKRIKRKDGQYYFPFPLYDKDGNEIPISGNNPTLESPTKKVDKKSSNGA
jgi:hypothetical protein